MFEAAIWRMLPQFLLNGIMVGGIYALMALGLVMIYKSTRIFKFAVGDLMMVGGFMAWMFMDLGAPPLLAILLAIGAGALIFGGLESIPGALLGGLAVGVLQDMMGGLIDPSIKEITAYLVLLGVLIFKTEGLFGLKRIERIGNVPFRSFRREV